MYKDNKGNLKSNHSLKNCRRFKELYEAHGRAAQPAPQPLANITSGQIARDAPPPPLLPARQVAAVQQARAVALEEEEEAYPPSRGRICMIQEGRPSNRHQKQISRQVYLAATSYPAVLDYLNGSETDITFSREDHPPAVPRPGHAALVLEA